MVLTCPSPGTFTTQTTQTTSRKMMQPILFFPDYSEHAANFVENASYLFQYGIDFKELSQDEEAQYNEDYDTGENYAKFAIFAEDFGCDAVAFIELYTKVQNAWHIYNLGFGEGRKHEARLAGNY